MSTSSKALITSKKAGDEYKKAEQERPVRLPIYINPKELLDKLSTRQILDYLRLYRNQRI